MKQPDRFVVDYICKDKWAYEIKRGKPNEIELQARFVKLFVKKSADAKSDSARIRFDQINKEVRSFDIPKFTGYYTFSATITERFSHIQFELKPKQGKIRYFGYRNEVPKILELDCRALNR